MVIHPIQSSVSGTSTGTSTSKYHTFNNEAEYKSWLGLEFVISTMLTAPLSIHLTSNHRPTDPQTPWNSNALWILKGASTLSASEPLQPMGSLQGRSGPIDLYTLTPGYEYEIRNAHQQRLKGISFIYKNGVTLEPLLHD
jgi:hypothetical protein